MSDDKIVPLPSMRPRINGLPVARVLGPEIVDRVEKFVLEGLSGNVILNFKEGRIRGFRYEVVRSLK